MDIDGNIYRVHQIMNQRKMFQVFIRIIIFDLNFFVSLDKKIHRISKNIPAYSSLFLTKKLKKKKRKNIRKI